MAKRLTTKQFIEKAEKVHGNTYDYSQVEYKTTHEKVDIVCAIHGVFKQSPNNHLSGNGCHLCVNQGTSLEKRIKDFKKVHGNKYDYSLVDYKGNKSPIIIICPIHGKFQQIPSSHLLGCGCQKCADEERLKYHRSKPTGWKLSNWIKMANKSKYFDSYKVYIIEIKTVEEHFYKIGRTFNTLERRFMGLKNMPYEYKVLKVFTGSAEEMFNLEIELKRKNKLNKYLPIKNFNGKFECYKQIKI